MRVTCDHCGARYSVAEDKLKNRERKFRCKHCRQIITIRPRSRQEPAAAQEWLFGLDGREQGPYNLEQAQHLIRQGKITRDYFVWREGLPDWLPVEQVDEINHLFSPSRPPAPPPSRPVLLTQALGSGPGRERTTTPTGTNRAPRQTRPDTGAGKAGQQATSSPGEKIERQQDDDRRRQLLLKVAHKRQAVRAERQADRIAEHFFTRPVDNDDAPLPPPVDEAEQIAGRLEHEADQEESRAADPLAGLLEQEQPLPEEISKVTKVLADQAGLGVVHKSRRLGITVVAILAVAGLLGGFIWLGARQGWFKSIGIGGGSSNRRDKQEVSMADLEKLSPEEKKRLHQLWELRRKDPGGGKKNQVAGSAQAQSARPLTSREKQLLAFYQQQQEGKREVAPRGPRGLDSLAGPSLVDLPSMSGGFKITTSPGSGSKPEIKPSGPAAPLSSQQLTELQIRQVVALHRKKIQRCLEKQLKRDARIAGKMILVARVTPQGRVESVRSATEKFHGTIVEECLLKEVRNWRFPAFSGEAYELSFPLLLSARGKY